MHHDTFIYGDLSAEFLQRNRTNDSILPGSLSGVYGWPTARHPHAKERYAQDADYLGLGGKTADDKVEKLIAAIEDLKAKVGIPKSIKEAGVPEKEFLAAVDTLSEKAFDDQCTTANPRYPLITEIKQMYLDAYYGK